MQKLKISFCGRVGSFSHEAAISMYENAIYIQCDTFIQAISMVEANNADYAIIPIENSTAGRVSEIHNIVPNLNLYITKEKILKISHNLYVLNNKISINDLTTVTSHTQALMQCSKFLSKYNIKTENAINTAIAAENLSNNKDAKTGVICSFIAGNYYNLHLLEANIQDNNDNATIFVSFGKNPNKQTFFNPLTSIIFETSNKSGGIYEALGCFAKHSVNLLKLESYIPFGASSSNVAKFFVTFQGSNFETSTQNALDELQLFAVSVKNLGTYESDEKRFC